MKVFDRDGKVNFVDENNVILGYDMNQNCCEDADWFITPRDLRQGVSMPEETVEAKGLSFRERLLKAVGPLPTPTDTPKSRMALDMIRDAAAALSEVLSKGLRLHSSEVVGEGRTLYRLVISSPSVSYRMVTSSDRCAGLFEISPRGWPVRVMVNREWVSASSKAELEDVLVQWIGSRDLREYVYLIQGFADSV